MNTGEANDTNALLNWLTGRGDVRPQDARAAAERLADRAYQRLGTGQRGAAIADAFPADSPAALMSRLNAAEAVALMFGWSPVVEGQRYDACFQLWRAWVAIVGQDFCDPTRHPQLSDKRITELARQRCDEREATLTRLRGED